ncbi:hypothetical protein AA309_15575 [Microvirga vignae]|uniref:AP2/ERF domain-containing protein n=1 Tax=Microvirga vignae TaxID=1225564 RepID=A0A0H1RAX8_9HYPH|nr:hypothetical protein [Microvirga vignae]KLK92234.1 hypothetical protein AA309_15575 [Microvirga vignae]
MTAKGNWTLWYEGYRITIFKRNEVWSGVITDETTGAETWARRRHENSRKAKLAAFDTILRLRHA